MKAKDNPIVEILGVPLDLGVNIRGANLGPSAIRNAGLHEKILGLSYEILDQGDLRVPLREHLKGGVEKKAFFSEVIEVCRDLAKKTQKSCQEKRLPLCLGGDHSVAIGSIFGVNAYLNQTGKDLGLIWIDAHADLNTQSSSPSGNLHGMPVAYLIDEEKHATITEIAQGLRVKPENIAIIGLRSVDKDEGRLIKEKGINFYTMQDIDRRGMFSVMQEAIDMVGARTGGLHLSFDLDAIDPSHAPGVSTAVSGGINLREAYLALEMIANSKKLLSMDFVELNPMFDKRGKSSELVVSLVETVLGKTVV